MKSSKLLFSMKYPILEINLQKLKENTKTEVEYFRNFGIEVMGVNKVFNGAFETAEAVMQGGITVIAESISANLKKLSALPCEKALLRSPGLSEIPDVIAYADISVACEVKTLEALSKEAVLQNKAHKILLMIDMGDIREGLWFENEAEIETAVSKILELPMLEIYGLGTNYGCYGTVLPSEKSALDFIAIARRLEEKFSFKFPYLSGGNCSSFNLVDKGLMPPEINHLRIGGQHQFGIEYVEGRYLDGYAHSTKDISKYVSDAYILKAEIIEVRDKPTVPVGELGVDAFMKTKTFEDRGIRRHAILSFGLQEVPSDGIHPVDEGIRVMGQTSNHTIIDIEDVKEQYQLGDIIPFEVDYTALMFLCNTSHITKAFI